MGGRSGRERRKNPSAISKDRRVVIRREEDRIREEAIRKEEGKRPKATFNDRQKALAKIRLPITRRIEEINNLLGSATSTRKKKLISERERLIKMAESWEKR